jgi:predicted nucleic acid-binding protein
VSASLHFVLDTGALIGAEKGDAWALRYFDLRKQGLARLTIPRVCVLEWWRGRTDWREKILQAANVVEPLADDIAKAAGVAQAKVKGSTAIDAAVMATAALRDGIVITADVEDFTALTAHFVGVRVFGPTDAGARRTRS